MSLQKLRSESIQFPLSRMQQKKCMFVNQLMAEAMMEMVDESELHIPVQKQMNNVYRDSVA